MPLARPPWARPSWKTRLSGLITSSYVSPLSARSIIVSVLRPEISAKSIAEFKLTSTVNEEIVLKIHEILEQIDRIDRPERPLRPEHREHPVRSTQ